MTPLRHIGIFLPLLLVLGLLAGCAADPLAEAHGPLFALNPGHWTPTKAQLTAPPRVPRP